MIKYQRVTLLVGYDDSAVDAPADWSFHVGADSGWDRFGLDGPTMGESVTILDHGPISEDSEFARLGLNAEQVEALAERLRLPMPAAPAYTGSDEGPGIVSDGFTPADLAAQYGAAVGRRVA